MRRSPSSRLTAHCEHQFRSSSVGAFHVGGRSIATPCMYVDHAVLRSTTKTAANLPPPPISPLATHQFPPPPPPNVKKSPKLRFTFKGQLGATSSSRERHAAVRLPKRVVALWLQRGGGTAPSLGHTIGEPPACPNALSNSTLRCSGR